MKKLISICTPAYNESACVGELVRRLAIVFDALADRYDFEAIICDNGSTDDTAAKIQAAIFHDARFKLVRLSRNFGTEGGATAALSYASGDAAVIMNSDLQDPPEYIPELVAQWEQGFQNVYAIVNRRADEGMLRRLSAKAYYAIVSALSDYPIPRSVSDFRLVDRALYRIYLAMPERYRMIRFMWAWLGFRSIGIQTDRPARGGGRSTFRFFTMLHSGLRSVLAQSRAPLTIIPVLGLGLTLLSFAFLALAIVRAVFYGVPFAGFGTIIATMLFLFALLFLFLWMISEYIMLIFEEVRHRPTFVVAETHGFDRKAEGD